ncbi:uncharacterized protein LOC128867763 [Anastrepha ludens]|uniref:uncharacterized protein LOC128867763 n=1 Tax=Anastrepha ludens TaxID=28586 RepID=UPI0023B041E9|nr:uncharacterized protein LOC128867763 [Anastrepha ludens]XP_053965214.1 uncharacterized protein LOC128867763 [Anastrepha ludens]
MLASLQHPNIMATACMLFPLLLAIWPQSMQCRPTHGYTTDGTELVVVKEIVRCTRQGLHELCQNATTITNEREQQQRFDNVDNESVMDIVDDLILLEKKARHTQQQRKEKNPFGTYEQQSELLTSAAAREDTLVAAAAAEPAIGDPSDSTALGSSYHQEPFDSDSDSDDADGDDNSAANIKTADVDAVNAAAADEIIADGVLFHGVLLRLADGPHSVPQPVSSIDMSDFVSLIPAEEVKSIAANYYHNDAEVRRAYAYLSGRDFVALRQHIVASPEVGAFLQYLNVSGFDVLKFVNAIVNLTKIEGNNARGDERIDKAEMESQTRVEAKNTNTVVVVNEISKAEQNVPPSNGATPTSPSLNETMPIATTRSPIATTKFDETATQQEQQLNGLHGLVDSILEILPQDQILSTFFDKLETDENFRKFVHNIQRPAFAQILSKMEQSMSLRNLIFTLHNNGIYITRIVDSLKAYFFLGGFS